MKNSTEQFKDAVLHLQTKFQDKVRLPGFMQSRIEPWSDEEITKMARMFATAAQVAADERIDERITNDIEKAS